MENATDKQSHQPNENDDTEKSDKQTDALKEKYPSSMGDKEENSEHTIA